jgi:hypothetical protein
LLGAAVVLAATFVRIEVDGIMQPIKLAFPWTFPLGAALTLGLGLALGRLGSDPNFIVSSPTRTKPLHAGPGDGVAETV